MAGSMQPEVRMVVTHFIVSDDVERSRRFYTEVLGGTVVFGPEPTNIALANSYIIINVGGGPTDDKPTVTLATPSDPDRVSSFLNLRVADIHAVYAEWSAGRAVPDTAEAAPVRDPLLHARSRRVHHRGRADHRSTRRLVARRLAADQPRRTHRRDPARLSASPRPAATCVSTRDGATTCGPECDHRVVKSPPGCPDWLTVVTASERPDLWQRVNDEGLFGDVWPEYNHHGNHTAAYFGVLFTRFPDFQTLLVDERTSNVVARGRTVPFRWEGTLDDLPAGIDAVGLRAVESDATPDTLSALAAEVDLPMQGLGLSSILVTVMGRLAADSGFRALVAPVRPSLKAGTR